MRNSPPLLFYNINSFFLRLFLDVDMNIQNPSSVEPTNTNPIITTTTVRTTRELNEINDHWTYRNDLGTNRSNYETFRTNPEPIEPITEHI